MYRKLILLLLFAVAVLPMRCGDPRAPEVAPLPEISDAISDTLKEAQKRFEENPHLDPRVQLNTQMHYIQGVNWQENNEHIWAIHEFSEAIKIQPTADAFNARAKSLLALKRYSEALDDLNAALELNPDFAFAYWGRAKVLEKRGQFEEAIQDFNKAVRLAPNNADLYVSRGSFYCFSVEDYQKSVDDFTKAIELAPGTWDHYANRALTHYKYGDYESAAMDCTMAIERMPPETNATHQAKVYFTRHKSYENLGEVEKSTADYRKAKELDPTVLR